MGKYTPLRDFLVAQAADRISMTFEEIEELLGFRLPASKQYPAWWSNNPSNNPMTEEWLSAGFETEKVDVRGGKLTFRRAIVERRGRDTSDTDGDLVEPPLGFHPLFGCMKGAGNAAPRVDLTDPPDPSLATRLDQAYGAKRRRLG